MLTSVSSWLHQPESVHQPAAVFDLCHPSAFQQFGANLISGFSLSFVNLWIGVHQLVLLQQRPHAKDALRVLIYGVATARGRDAEASSTGATIGASSPGFAAAFFRVAARCKRRIF